ncbi:MAG: hypothetical protein AAFO82_09380 [Bacteroidota bacterium]
MKGTVCSLLFLVSFCFLSAQDYHPLLEKGKTWNLFYWQNTCFVNPCGGTQYSLGGDTIIEGLKYKKIIQKSIIALEEPVFYPPFGLSKDSPIISYMREDTLNKKIYALNNYLYEDNIEYLTYDFDLQSGDSLVVSYLDSIFVILDTVEIIKLSNGEYRKMYLFKNSDPLLIYPPYYIEGIGGDSGLFFPFLNTIESNVTLGCVRQNGVDLYENLNSTWGCETVTATQNVESRLKVSIFPNPVSDILNISCKGCKLHNIEMIDVNGNLVFHKQLNQMGAIQNFA